MLTRSLKPALLAAFLGAACPALAQVHVELPSVEIRIGRTAPPRLRHERRPPRPGRDFVWLAGAWDWQGDGWVWVPGRWDRPAYRHAKWIAPRYRRDGAAWVFEPGHWSGQRLVEGDEYRRWRSEHGDRDRDRHHDRDRDRDRDRP